MILRVKSMHGGGRRDIVFGVLEFKNCMNFFATWFFIIYIRYFFWPYECSRYRYQISTFGHRYKIIKINNSRSTPICILKTNRNQSSGDFFAFQGDVLRWSFSDMTTVPGFRCAGWEDRLASLLHPAVTFSPARGDIWRRSCCRPPGIATAMLPRPAEPSAGRGPVIAVLDVTGAKGDCSTPTPFPAVWLRNRWTWVWPPPLKAFCP